ncbi:hypothetical protein [Erythrobacter colymbi]|uniref:hypothetical protein n=1 Tax=Erythrobacter colymbi TaxID=1161202 RepID=UPI000A3D4E55|nr:hypothetical protein [Erythrobacter colymbi]
MTILDPLPELPITGRPNVISGLLTKRAEIAGLVEGLQDRLREALINLDHIDQTILLFDPEADLAEVKAKPLPPRHIAFKGQVTRSILQMLRATGESLDSKAITLRLMAERELNTADAKLLKTIQKRVGAALRNMRDRGLVTSDDGKSGLLQWRLAQRP